MKGMTLTAGWCLAFFLGAQAAGAEEVFVDPEIAAQQEEKVEIIVDLKEEPIAVQEKEAADENMSFNAAAVETSMKETTEAFKSFLDEENVLYDEINEFEEVLHGFSMTLSGSSVEAFSDLEYIDGIYLSQTYTAAEESEIDAAEQEEAFAVEAAALADTGLTGKGIKLGVIDTGLDYKHPDLKHAYKGGKNLINDGQKTPLEGYGIVTSSHGTNVSGVIAGKGRLKGVAPDVSLYAYRALNNQNQGKTGAILGALEQAVKDDMDIVNLSLGSENNQSDTAMTKAINNAVKTGMVVVAAGGNNGKNGAGSVGDPGTAALAITVGASYSVNGREAIAPFSSRGPVAGSQDIKPDLVAPGYSVYSATSLSASPGQRYANAYGYYSGTSFSAPYVAGIAALMLEKNAQMTPEEVKAKLMNTSTEVPQVGVNDAGAGRVNPAKALEAPVSAYVRDTHSYMDKGKMKKMEYWNASFNFQNVTAGGSFREDRTLQLRNTSSQPVTYNLTSETLKNSTLKIETPKKVTLQAGEVKDVTVTLRASSKVKGGYHEGYLLLKSDNQPALRIPYGGTLEVAANPITSFQADRTLAGKNQKLNISWGISSDYTASIAVLNGETKKVLGHIPVKSGTSSLAWDMKYEPASGGAAVTIADGDYQLQLKAQAGSRTFQKELPLKVYSQAPQISIQEKEVVRNEVAGAIASYFSEQKEAASALTATYELKQGGSTYSSGKLALQDNGNFTLRNQLKEGTSTLKIQVQDKLSNKASSSFKIHKTAQSYERGDENAGVGELQHSLKALGFHPSKDAENVFGAHTEEKVKALQQYYQQEVTGKADSALMQFLASILEGTYATPADQPEVTTFKQRLTNLGFGTFPQKPSTRYGPVTEGVVRDYQEHHQLQVNGFGDPVTLAHMEKEWERSFKDGDDKKEIRAFKQKLTELGFGSFPANPSTRYGPVTSRVVSEFQEKNDLVVSGTANPITQRAVAEATVHSWQDGDEDSKIIGIKQNLTRLGYGTFPANPSPRYGPVTSGVVSEFQQDQSLPVTGNVDVETEAKLAELLTVVYQSGDSSEAIRTLKEQLTQLGFGTFPARPSVRYGPVTAGVVQDFQSHYGIEESGIVNRRVLQLLDRETNTVFQPGGEAAEIREVKMQLTALGFGTFPNDPSDRYGPVTAGVVEEFQQEQGLHVNGIVDAITYERIQEMS